MIRAEASEVATETVEPDVIPVTFGDEENLAVGDIDLELMGLTDATPPASSETPVPSLEEAIARIPAELRALMDERLRAEFRQVVRWKK